LSLQVFIFIKKFLRLDLNQGPSSDESKITTSYSLVFSIPHPSITSQKFINWTNKFTLTSKHDWSLHRLKFIDYNFFTYLLMFFLSSNMDWLHCIWLNITLLYSIIQYINVLICITSIYTAIHHVFLSLECNFYYNFLLAQVNQVKYFIIFKLVHRVNKFW
jgi:hypothetical protein